MTPTETAAILRQFNEWRSSDEDLPQPDAKQITAAIDAAVEMIERIPSRIIHKQAPGFVHEYSRESAEGYAHGWNACIKTITEKSK
jgi:hypothetical protein